MKKFVFVVCFAVFSILLFAQKSVVSFPTPEASSLGKYGQVPISLYNGLPQISIPLHTLHYKGFDFPISLSYHAQGNKPDEHPSWVGLGWNLNAGGMITRIVNTYRDEMPVKYFDTEMGFSPQTTNEIAYFYRMQDFNKENWYLPFLNKYSTNPEHLFTDNSPDEFIFNFGEYSGSFFFYRNEKGELDVKIKSKKGHVLKVEPILKKESISFMSFLNWADNNKKPTYVVFDTFQEFIISAENGVKYVFGSSDGSSIDYTTTLNYNNIVNTIATSWHLTKIILPSKDVISFSYKKGESNFVQTRSIFYYIAYNQLVIDGTKYPNNPDYYEYNAILIHPKYLEKITMPQGQEIIFSSSIAKQLGTILEKTDFQKRVLFRLLLNSVSEGYPPILNTINEYTNQYYQLDKIEIKNLKTINFSYNNSENQRLRLSELLIRPFYEPQSTSTNQKLNERLKYTFNYNQTFLPNYNSNLTDNWGFYNNKNYSREDYNNYFTYREAKLPYCMAEVLESIIYPTGGKTLFEYELNDYSKVVNGLTIATAGSNNAPFSLISRTGLAGGLRVKSITDYPNSNNLLYKLSKRCYYLNEDGKSSGILSGIPLYETQGSSHEKVHQSGWSGLVYYSSTIDIIHRFYMRSQNPIYPLSTTDGNHVTYSRVVEESSDGSKIVSKFTNHDEFPNEPPFMITTNVDFMMPWELFISKELERGLLKSQSFIDKNGQPKKRIDYLYNNDKNRYNNYIKLAEDYYSEKLYRLYANKKYTFYPYLQEKKVVDFNMNGKDSIVSTIKYKYNKHNLCSEIESVINNNIIVEKTTYSGDDFTEGATVYKEMRDSSFLNYPIEKVNMKNSNITNIKLFTYKKDKEFFLQNTIFDSFLKSPISSLNFTRFNGLVKDLHYSKDPEIEYTKYDLKGNIIEIRNKSGIYTSYLWGYNNQFPIAKIENASYNEVRSALAIDPNKLGEQTNPDMFIINQLRSHSILKKAQITTYTYDPLRGITSVTNADGKILNYAYDTMGRLLLIKDNSGKIISQYEYNYNQ